MISDIQQQKQPPEVFCKKGILRNFAKFTGNHLCQSLYFNKIADLRPATLDSGTLAQVFSCEFCKIFKNNFFTEHLSTTAFLTNNCFLHEGVHLYCNMFYFYYRI